ncbi:hypothetical protein ACVW0J_007982 [Bradyrhizobium sp. i1.7.7]
MTKKISTATGREQHEGRILQGAGHLAAQSLRARALGPDRLQNVVQRARHLADSDQGDIHGRKQRRLARKRFGKALAGHDRGLDGIDDRTKPADVHIACEQFERIIQPGTGLQEQSKVAREDRDIRGPRLRQRQRRQRERPALGFLRGPGIDRD